MRIGVDLMGGDQSPDSLFDAVLRAAESLNHSSEFMVYLPQAVINRIAPRIAAATGAGAIAFTPAEEVIGQDEPPLEAARRKKKSSMSIGLQDLHTKEIDAFVSIGNTGALVASSTLTLKCFPTLSRPALLALLPTRRGSVAVVDVGGNVNCTAEQMVQFARMGAAYSQCCLGIATPKVGLLNIGQESLKGDSEVRRAYSMLEEQEGEYHFSGNIEGTTVFEGVVDVLVTDGFTGNVFLKASEGISALMCDYMRERDILQPLVEETFDYAEHPGALLCGLNGLVIKTHGYSSPQALYSGIKAAHNYASEGVVDKMRSLF